MPARVSTWVSRSAHLTDRQYLCICLSVCLSHVPFTDFRRCASVCFTPLPTKSARSPGAAAFITFAGC